MIAYKYRALASYTLIVFCIIQMAIFIYKYIEQAAAVSSNPLIPQGLTDYVRDFTLIVCCGYLLAILPNIYYLVRRRRFTYACILSILIILSLRIFLSEIANFLLS